MCMSVDYWDSVRHFAERAGVALVWDLNVLLRTENGDWDAANATALLERINAAGGGTLAALQLGNEPELYPEKRNITDMTPQKLAKDFHALRSLVSARFANITGTIFGPDACCESDSKGKFLREFVSAADGAIDAVTVHDYPVGRLRNGSCDPEGFIDKRSFGSLEGFLSTYAGYVRQAGSQAPLILGEVATTDEGGCSGYSSSFISGFAFVYELGSVAASGYVQLNRQDIIGAQYALVGPPGWASGPLGTPHPDYFTAVLFKQIVGRHILRVTNSNPSDSPSWDARVWCTHQGGLPVLSFINPSASSVTVAVTSSDGKRQSMTPRVEYVLTAGHDGLLTNNIYLNDDKLFVHDNGSLPVYPIPGRRIATATDTSMEVPPWSYGLVVLEGQGSLPACE
jgi:heparanase